MFNKLCLLNTKRRVAVQGVCEAAYSLLHREGISKWLTRFADVSMAGAVWRIDAARGLRVLGLLYTPVGYIARWNNAQKVKWESVHFVRFALTIRGYGHSLGD